MSAAAPPPLVVLSPGTARDAAGAREVERHLLGLAEAGLSGLCLREPQLDDGPLLALARRLREALADGWLCVHDSVHVAEAADADAVHLGWRSLAPRDARRLLPATTAVGFSSHAGDAAADVEGADYLWLSPLHPVDKPHAAEALGQEGLAREVARRAAPCWALGGVTTRDCAAAAAAGARGVAVLSGIHGADDPRSALDLYRRAADAAFGA